MVNNEWKAKLRKAALIAGKYLAIFTALAVFGISMGFFVGICSSEIATTFIPLVFGFLAAGGYVATFFKAKGDASVTEADRRKWAIFLTVQFSGIALGLLAGFWLGVLGKFRPDLLWPLGEPATEYASVPVASPLQLALAREIDRKLAADGLSAEQRRQILRRVIASVKTDEQSVKGHSFQQPASARNEDSTGSKEEKDSKKWYFNPWFPTPEGTNTPVKPGDAFLYQPPLKWK